MTSRFDDGVSERMHPVLLLARQAVESFVRDRRIIDPPQDLPSEMEEQAGVFVCLKKKGDLRGCIGTFEPTEENVAREIIQNAISSATRDPRFPPIKQDELRFLSYSVDILTPPEPVESTCALDPKKFGVIVRSGARRGLLLPDLEGVDSPADQIAIASRKAGIKQGEVVRLFRFEVRRYQE